MSGEDEQFMREALKEAQKAAEEDEVPVGCVIVRQRRIIARAHNSTKKLRDPTAHAEMLAITQAADACGYERLNDCTLYVTAEPCIMCAGAIILARLKRVVYGCEEPKFGGAGSVLPILHSRKLNHRPQIRKGVLAQEAALLLRSFFRARRQRT